MTKAQLDWEIVYMRGTAGRLHPLNWQSHLCEREKCTIHSVKRLRDGEVFSVEDEVSDISGKDFMPIKKFFCTVSNMLWAQFDDDGRICVRLNSLVKKFKRTIGGKKIVLQP